MKKLLSILSVSTFVGTSASNLKPLFTSNVSQSFKSDQTNKNIKIQSLQNNTNFDIVTNNKLWTDADNNEIQVLAATPNGDVYFSDSLYGISVLKKGETTPINITGIPQMHISTIATNASGDVYFGGNNNSGLWVLKHDETKSELVNSNFSGALLLNTNGDIYFSNTGGLWVLKSGETTPTKILDSNPDSIDISINGDIYFSSNGTLWVLQKNATNSYILDTSKNIHKVVATVGGDIFVGGLENNKSGLWVLKSGETTLKLISGTDSAQFKSINDIATNSNGDVYFCNSYFDDGNLTGGLWVLKSGETTPTKLLDSKKSQTKFSNVSISINGDIYYTEQTKKGETTTLNVFNTALSWTKLQTTFNLQDKTKTMYWLSDNQVVANDKLHINIKNNLIGKVKINNKVQPQINKTWNFDIGNIEQDLDFIITINFTIDSKHYQSQIIVSSLLTIPNVTISNTATSYKIKEYQGILPINKKVGDIPLTSSTFYNDSEITLELNSPTPTTKITGVIFGLDKKWAKTGESRPVDLKQEIKLDGSQLNAYLGRYLIETMDSANNKQSYYLVVSNEKTNEISNFWDTNQGEYFYNWAVLNGYDKYKIKSLKSVTLNNIINQSVNWNKKLATDQEIGSALYKELTIKAKIGTTTSLSKEDIIKVLKNFVPKTLVIKNEYTNTYNPTKVSFEIHKVVNDSEYKPNDIIFISVFYNKIKINSFNLTISDKSPTPSPTPNPNNNIGWYIFLGIFLGLITFGIAGFYINKFVIKPIRNKRSDIKSDKYVAEQMELSKKWKEQETKEKQAREKKKGGK